MRRLARRARLARTQAEATVRRSLSEPETRHIDARQSQAALGGLRRLVSAAHVLRLDAQEDGSIVRAPADATRSRPGQAAQPDRAEPEHRGAAGAGLGLVA